MSSHPAALAATDGYSFVTKRLSPGVIRGKDRRRGVPPLFSSAVVCTFCPPLAPQLEFPHAAFAPACRLCPSHRCHQRGRERVVHEHCCRGDRSRRLRLRLANVHRLGGAIGLLRPTTPPWEWART